MMDILALILGLILAGYLLFSIFRPEKF